MNSLLQVSCDLWRVKVVLFGYSAFDVADGCYTVGETVPRRAGQDSSREHSQFQRHMQGAQCTSGCLPVNLCVDS
jgi:hypothetical protein